MNLTRRQLLESLAAAWASQIYSRLAFATPEREPHFFVMLRTFGGMDVTLGLDPQVLPPGADREDMFIEYRPEEILPAHGLKLGPAAKALVPHAGKCAIVNGVMMRRDAGHDVGNLYMVSGRGDGKAAVLSVELALTTPQGPFGVVINQPIYVAGKAVTLSAVKDILEESEEGSLIELIEERIRRLASARGTPFEEAQRKIVQGKEAAARLSKILAGFRAEVNPSADRHILAAALASGAAAHAQIDLQSGDLDTHSNHEKRHLESQTKIWDQVADLFALFKRVPFQQGSLFDATTFMVVSEFSRTPALNAAKGKDHNPFTNSVLLAGKKIRGGTTAGASRLIPRGRTTHGMSDHIARPFDYKNGRIAEKPEGASFIFPENVARTVAGMFGAPLLTGAPPIPGLSS